MIDTADLRQLQPFTGLIDHELAALAAVMERREVARGAYVIHAQGSDQCLMFVAKGKVKVQLAGADGRDIPLDVLGIGDFFGEIALLTGEPRTADVVAAEDSIMLVLSRADFDAHVLQHGGLTLALLRELAARLRDTTNRAAELAALLARFCRCRC